MRRRRYREIVLGAGLLTACGPEVDEPIPDFEIETEWLTIRGYDREQEEICGGTLEWMDSYLDDLSGRVGLSRRHVATYDWYSQASWKLYDPCPPWSACVKPRERDDEWLVHSRWIPHEHELVHIVARQYVEKPCLWLLDEGLAEYLGEPEQEAGGLERSSIEDVLAVTFDGARGNSDDYARARHFVSFLVFEFGLDDVLILCANAPHDMTRDEFSDVAVSKLGSGLDELLLGYADYPICKQYEDRGKLWECSRPPIIELGPNEARMIEIEASCSNPEAVGPRVGDVYHFSYQVRILADGEYSWRFEFLPPYEAAQAGLKLQLEQCASCGDGALGFYDEWTPDYIALPRTLTAGDYTLSVQFPLEVVANVRVRFKG